MTSTTTAVEKPVLRIGCDAMPEGELTRFVALFQVAQTRSVAAWTRVPPHEAQVVVSHGLPWRVPRVVSLCIDAPLSCRDVGDVFPLESGFRVASLIQALDEAAVRVRQLQGLSGATAATGYQLRHWLVLGADKHSANHARVLAAMSRRAVTREWMTTGGGLRPAEIDALLAELRAHGALQELSARSSAPVRDTPAPSELQALANRPGLVGRLRLWLSSARTSETSARRPA